MIGFHCPKCGCEKLVERRIGLEEIEEVIGVRPNGELLYCGVPEVSGGQTSGYECSRCRTPLEGCESPVQLVALLKGRPKKEKKD